MEVVKEKMHKILDIYAQEIENLRTDRVSPKLLQKLLVEYHGSKVPLQQLANVMVSENRTLTIQPWDVKSINALEKSILTSELSLNPISDGRRLRVSVPALSEQRRQEIAKNLKTLTEKFKVELRNLRRNALDEKKKLQKDKEISEDEVKRFSNQVQKLLDETIDILVQKEKVKLEEILEKHKRS